MLMSNKIEKKGYESPGCEFRELLPNFGMLQSTTPSVQINDWVEGDDEMF